MDTRAGLDRNPRDPLAELLAEQQRICRRVLDLPRLVELACTTRVGTTPHDVVYSHGAVRLLRYRRTSPATHTEPLLLCYALINRPYILDLQPDKSVARQYLDQGFDVYMIDWGIPTDADRRLSLEDYVFAFLKGAVDFVLQQHRLERLHLLGYCMGGTLSALFVALHPGLVKTLTLLAAPIDFADRTPLLHLWTDRKRFDVDAFVDTHGNCPGWFLQACFTAMKPIQNFIEKNISFYEQADDARAVASYFAMERWINDNIPVAGETFRQFVKKLYQANELVRGELHLGDQRVDLARIACPLLLLTASKDHLVAPASTDGIRPHVASEDVESVTIDAGHVGLVVGGKARTIVWPRATRWLADRSTPVSSILPAGVMGEGGRSSDQ